MIKIFFFQAEDGIRDLVRSRGLGDVYKRQPVHILAYLVDLVDRHGAPAERQCCSAGQDDDGAGPMARAQRLPDERLSLIHISEPTRPY